MAMMLNLFGLCAALGGFFTGLYFKTFSIIEILLAAFFIGVAMGIGQSLIEHLPILMQL